ncbi:hypothetical protein [Colwellia sp. E2M01]|uniref:hypothetical protein n=1 Tax=Colwellia sp. E2M01 TaxID=2841561 RepID=UPI001C080A4B|nr:hypothetical protein [Colwellia sp. E2M01]MBU2871967.1 hypothetical protein [Colwellia sp. E2M01]
MMSLILSIIGGTFKDWVSSKSKAELLKAEAKIENSKNSLIGWSDEFLVLIWSYPFISLFIPPLRESTQAAFEQLGIFPDWYVGGFLSISFAVFGIDKLFRWKKNND